MDGYEIECAKTFLDNQDKLFREPVAYNIDEAIEFLKDSFACIFNTVDEIRDYWEENGIDISGMTDDDIAESLEVFLLPDGRYLVIEA
jgi:hypothetical protein